MSVKRSRLNGATLFILVLILIGVNVTSCNKDDQMPPGELDDSALLFRSSWSPAEKVFFNFYNDSQLLENVSDIRNRTSVIPDILLSVFNQTVEDNDQDSFVVDVIERIGYPVWLNAYIESTVNGSEHIVYIPFVREDTNRITGFLIGYKDYSLAEPELRMDIRLANDLALIERGEIPITQNTCHDLMRFYVLDSITFNASNVLADNLVCEACLGDSSELGIMSPQITTRSCETVEIVICYFDSIHTPEGWISYTNPNMSTIGGSVIFGWNPPGLWGIWSPPGSQGGGLYNPNSGSIFGGIWGALGGAWEAILNLFRKKVKCPGVELTGEEEILTRSGEDTIYICNAYTVVRCFNGDWWEIVESIPCPTCDGNITLPEWYQAQCSDGRLQFFEDYQIPLYFPKVYGMDFTDCCAEGNFDYGCAISVFISTVLDFDPEGPEMDCIESNIGVKNEIFMMIKDRTLIDACNPSNSSNELLHDAIQAACDNSPSLNMETLLASLSNTGDFIVLKNLDKSPALQCAFDMLKDFGLCGEIIDNYEELEGHGMKLQIIYDYDGALRTGDPPHSRFPYNQDGSFCCGQSDYCDTEPILSYHPETNELESAYSTIFWNKWFPELTPIEMCSYFIHEMLHAEFFRWVAEDVYPAPVFTGNFLVTSPIWTEIVVKKYGENTDPHHHSLMAYFVNQISLDLWSLNGETDVNRIDYYKYFAYDLFDSDEGLVEKEFLTQSQLDYYKSLYQTIISNTTCD